MGWIVRSVWVGLMCALGLVAAAPASAHELWVLGEDSDDVTVIDTTTNEVVGEPIAVGDEPRSIAFSPDGASAYIVNRGDHSLSIVDTATKAVAAPLELGSFAPTAVAIAPDGSRIFVAGTGGLVALDPSTGAMLGERWSIDSAPPVPEDLAVSPDGSHAYAPMSYESSVAEFDLRSYTGHEVATTRGERLDLECGVCPMRSAAITPDGSQVVIGGEYNGILDTAAHTLTRLTDLGYGTTDVAISPDGANAFAVGERNALWRYSLPSGVFDGTTRPPSELGRTVALNPAGDTLYVGFILDSELYVLDEATHIPIGEPIELDGRPVAMAVTPDQAPTAALTASSDAGDPGLSVSFDASASSDPDGTIARYDWDFGDGTTAADAGPEAEHVYTTPGSFRASVTVTDDEHCGAKRIYTGQSVSCNGGPVAVATAPVVIKGPPTPPAQPGGGAPPAAPAPKLAPLDTAPPQVRLLRGSAQAAGPSLAIPLSCDEACTVTVTGKLTVLVPGSGPKRTRPRQFSLGRATGALVPGSPKTLRLKVPKAAVALLAQRGVRASVGVSVVASDAAGNSSHLQRGIVVRRAG